MAARKIPQARDPLTGHFERSWVEGGRTITWINPHVPDESEKAYIPLAEIVAQQSRWTLTMASLRRVLTRRHQSPENRNARYREGTSVRS
jgi:hypothetical protein